MSLPAPPEPQRYPPARATHAEVYGDPALFHETLRELFDALDIRVAKVMKLGGQELNLHLLYQRVRLPPPPPPPAAAMRCLGSR